MKTRNYSLQQRINRTEAVYHALGEAAYEGNIGAVEVARFYMNADDSQIQEFETELDSGNETEAWDIVQRFHGVDLVGIGSDQPTPRETQVAGQIDEYFNKKNNKKTLTYDLLYEMIKEVYLVEASTDLGTANEFITKAINALKGQFPDLSAKKETVKKVERIIGFTNVGNRYVRADFVGPLSREAERQGYELDVSYDSKDTTLPRGFWLKKGGKRVTNKLGISQGGAASGEATKFEKNLIVALNNAELDLKAQMAYGMENFTDPSTGKPQINTDERYQKSAMDIAGALMNLTKPSGDKEGEATKKLPQGGTFFPASGGRATGTLTEPYLKWGATSEESKADLLWQNSETKEQIGVSVKKVEDAQFMSTQGPECAAVFDVVAKEMNIAPELEGHMENFLKQLRRAMTPDGGSTVDKELKDLGKEYAAAEKPDVGDSQYSTDAGDEELLSKVSQLADEYRDAAIQNVYKAVEELPPDASEEDIEKHKSKSPFKSGGYNFVVPELQKRIGELESKGKLTKKQQAELNKLQRALKIASHGANKDIGNFTKGMAYPFRDEVQKQVQAVYARCADGDEEACRLKGELEKNFGTKSASKKNPDKVDSESSKVVFQKLLTNLVGLDCQGSLSPLGKAMLNSVMGNVATRAESSFVQLANNLQTVFDDPAFRQGVVKEGLTGDGKFEDEAAKAYAILKWSIGNPQSSDWEDMRNGESWNDSYFQQKAVDLKLGFRDRGDGRGFALRGDAASKAACGEIKEELFTGFDWSEIHEYKFTEDEEQQIVEQAAVLSEAIIGDQVLVEGWLGDLVDKGLDIAKKGAGWVKKTFNEVVKYATEALIRLGNWLKKLLQESFSKFMRVMGFDTTEMTVIIENN